MKWASLLRQTPSVLRWPDRGDAGLNRWVRGEVGGVAEECLGAAAGGGKLQQSTAGTGCELSPLLRVSPIATSLTVTKRERDRWSQQDKPNPLQPSASPTREPPLPALAVADLSRTQICFTVCQPSQL